MEIKDLDKVLQFVGPNAKIINVSSKPLTALGENYGSLMLALEIKLQINNGCTKHETINLVAKMCPPNEYLKKIFDTLLTFKKEIAVYSSVFPTLKTFQQEQGMKNVIEFFPKCYGARISLNPNSNAVDDDAILLLENLKLSGYQVVDRMKGFDLQTTELLLKDLAVFHAVPLALKQLNSDLFKNTILPHLPKNTVFDGISDNAMEAIINFILKTSTLDERSKKYTDNIVKSMKYGLENYRNPQPLRETYATINHSDYWVNNTMIKFENNNPIQNKMLDFQLIDYGSSANDIVFFLFSSVQMSVIETHYDNLLQIYYNTFIKTLKEMNCNTTPFTFKLLLEEIDTSAKSTQFFHTMVMLKHILALKGKVKELSEITEEDLVADEKVSEEYKEKSVQIIQYFAKKNWI